MPEWLRIGAAVELCGAGSVPGSGWSANRWVKGKVIGFVGLTTRRPEVEIHCDLTEWHAKGIWKDWRNPDVNKIPCVPSVIRNRLIPEGSLRYAFHVDRIPSSALDNREEDGGGLRPFRVTCFLGFFWVTRQW